MQPPQTCPFCSIPDDRIVGRLGTAFAIRDAFPVSPGHTLIIPRRHIGSLFGIPGSDLLDLLQLLAQTKAALDREFQPDGYNIGVNDPGESYLAWNHRNVFKAPARTIET
ncbi:MAG: HIT family protein [Betaproteobacteria bacterium]|nr:HIT family protein [Betaproteobacteria bacterium]